QTVRPISIISPAAVSVGSGLSSQAWGARSGRGASGDAEGAADGSAAIADAVTQSAAPTPGTSDARRTMTMCTPPPDGGFCRSDADGDAPFAPDAGPSARPGLRAILQDLAGRELAGRAHHAAAGMRPGAALVVAVDRRPILRPAGRRAEQPHLRRQELAGEDVPFRQADGPLDVEGRPDFALEDEVPEAREERFQRRLDRVAEVLLLGVPVALAEVVGRVLDEARHDVLAGGRHVRVDRR